MGTHFVGLLLLAFSLRAASPGLVVVVGPGPGQTTTWVRATAGYNEDVDKTVCTMTVNRNGGSSNMHLYCTMGIGPAMRKLYDGDISVYSVGFAVSFGGMVNRVTLLLSRGNPVPDSWQMLANDDLKTGFF